MHLYKNPWFARYARKQNISDEALCEAVRRAESGLIDADLGGGLLKQRVARPGAGKSGGYRTILIFRTQVRALFVFGFAKSDRANLSAEEGEIFRKLAKLYLAASDEEINRIVTAQQWSRVECDEKKNVSK